MGCGAGRAQACSLDSDSTPLSEPQDDPTPAPGPLPWRAEAKAGGPASGGHAHRPSPRGGADVPAAGHHHAAGDKVEQGGVWLYEDEPDAWVPFPLDVAAKIKMAQGYGQKSLVYMHNKEAHNIDFANSQLVNWQTGRTHRVKFGVMGPTSHRTAPKPAPHGGSGGSGEKKTSSERVAVELVNADGHPTVRVFDAPSKGAGLVCEVPSNTPGYFLRQNEDQTFCQVSVGIVDGWVGTKHCRKQTSAAPAADHGAGRTADAGSSGLASAPSMARSGSSGPARKGGEWQWEGPNGSWKSFDDEIKELLMTARRLGQGEVVFSVGKDTYTADLEECVQKNLTTGFERKIRFARKQKLQLQFQWQLKNGTWVDYDDEENERLCWGQSHGEKSVTYAARGNEYTVDFVGMVQETSSTSNASSKRNVRIMVGDDVYDPGDPQSEPTRPSGAKASIGGTPSTGPTCKTPGCSKPTYNGKPGERCCRECGERVPAAGPTCITPGCSKPTYNGKLGSRCSRECGASPPIASPREKKFTFRPGETEPAAPPGMPKDAKFDKAFGAFGEPAGGPRRHASPPPGTGGAASGSGGGARSERPPQPSHHASQPPQASHPSRSDGGRAHSGGAAPPRAQARSGPKLPSGVTWPDEPKARAAAEEMFKELSKVPINERKKAFMKAVVKWHPDKNLDDEDTATDVFQFLQACKEWYLGE